MPNLIKKIFIVIAFIVLCSLSVACREQKTNSTEPSQKLFMKGEHITRFHDDSLFKPQPSQKMPLPRYPWEKTQLHDLPVINKEYFRCKGSQLNPIQSIQQKDQVERLLDCGGASQHSLPIVNEKEFVYPILIELLNYLQDHTSKRIVITSAHRCPQHNQYVDPSVENQYSKHMIGAEVAFYIQGLEYEPEKVVELIQRFYQVTPRYTNLKDYQHFVRYEKENYQLSNKPWMNKEIFIKLYTKHEGRNFDNRHPFPYLSIQVRFDRDANQRVLYSWDRAQQFKRY